MEGEEETVHKIHDLSSEKVEILQVMMEAKDINLSLVDVYRRTLLHYACEKNYFYSILYLL